MNVTMLDSQCNDLHALHKNIVSIVADINSGIHHCMIPLGCTNKLQKQSSSVVNVTTKFSEY